MNNGREVEGWWIAATEGLRGPLTQGEVFEAVRAGRVREGTLIRLGEAGDWITAIAAFPAAFASAGPVWSPPRPTPSSPATSSGTINDLNGKVDVGIAVLLSMITLGIYWDVWIYKRLAWYAERSGRPMGNRVTYFWLFIGFVAGSSFLSLVTFGALLILVIPLAIASVVFSALLISDIGKDQQAIIQNGGIASLAATPTVLVVLWAVSNGIAWTVILIPISIVMLVFFFMYFFKNHNAVIESIAR